MKKDTVIHESDGSALKENRALPASPKRNQIMTVGVAGILPHFGATTVSMQIAWFLFYKGKNVAYVEANDTAMLDMLLDTYEGVTEEKNGIIRYARMTMVRRKDIGSVLTGAFDWLVYDCGAVTDEAFDRQGFLEKDVQVICTGSKPLEIKVTAEALADDALRQADFIFRSVAPADRKDVLEKMGKRIGSTFFIGHVPDWFTYSPDDDEIYTQIVPLKA